MRSGSLFSGYGGLDLAAAEVLGCEPIWFCDVDPGASALLAHHYPHVPNLGDITAVDWTAVEPIDVLTGGFPCQDISNAGKREGITGARSGLWSHYADAIRVLRPRYVLIENVSALVVRGLDRVLADLASLGFDAEWATVRASDVGAPHRRERIFIAAADATGTGRGLVEQDDPVARTRGAAVRGRQAESGRRGSALADAPGNRRDEGRTEPTRLVRRSHAAERGATLANADRAGWQRAESAERRDMPAWGLAPDAQDDGREELHVGTVSDEARSGRVRDAAGSLGASPVNWGPYEPAICRWAAILGRPAPAPTVMGTRGGRVLNPELPEWMMGLPEGWITSVPGLSRNDQLKLAGNGVVPQQADAAFRYLLPLLAPMERAA